MEPAILELQILVTTQAPVPADAIVWIQGDRFDRGEKVLELWQNKMAWRIFLTGNNVLLGKETRPGEDNYSLDDMASWLIDRHVFESAIIIDSQAMNTRGQAVNTLELAQKSGWQTVLLVGSTHHQLRAFLTFLKRAMEINWPGKIINQPVHINPKTIPGGRNQTSQEIFEEEVGKIHLYQEHVAEVSQGLDYFNKTNQSLSFRPAVPTDSKLLFIWRNDPSAYQNFFNAMPITWEEHTAWLEKLLSDQNRSLFIITNIESKPIGQVRFDVHGAEAEISITLAPDQRGRGYGSRAIAYASDYFFKQNITVKKIIAKVKSDNPVSIQAFIKAGYKSKKINSFDSVIILEYPRIH